MKSRRAFITLVSGAAATWPVVARGQQQAMPVVGVLQSSSPSENSDRLAQFRQGLRRSGFVDGQNVTIEYRYADNQSNRLPELAADLVRRQAAVIFTSGGSVTIVAAKAATTTIPIVFTTGADPVKLGLVASLNRPGSNITGVSFLANALEAKRLGLLHELLPKVTLVGALVNSTNPNAESQSKDLQDAALALGLQLHVANSNNDRDFDQAFALMVQKGVGAIVVAADFFFANRHDQLVALAERYALPVIFSGREFTTAGGLASYGADFSDVFRQAGIYAGRILKGEKPADLPILQSTKFEFIINLKAAKALGLTLSSGLLSIADEVIE